MIALAKQELQKECIMQNFHFAKKVLLRVESPQQTMGNHSLSGILEKPKKIISR